MPDSLDELLRRAGVTSGPSPVYKSKHGTVRRRAQLAKAALREPRNRGARSKPTPAPAIHRPWPEAHEVMSPVEKAEQRNERLHEDIETLRSAKLATISADNQRLEKAVEKFTANVTEYLEKSAEKSTPDEAAQLLAAKLAPVPAKPSQYDVLEALADGLDPKIEGEGDIGFRCEDCGFTAYGHTQDEANALYRSTHGNGTLDDCGGAS